MPDDQAERQSRVEELADEYLECLLAGETLDRRAYLAAHSELADLLGPRLELVELMHRVARAQRPPAGETAELAPSAAPVERAVRVKCPHCGNGIQLVQPEATEVTCTGCGSSFHLDLRTTASYQAGSRPRSVGKFVVLEHLGRGAYGTVYKARDPALQRIVAVKVPRAGTFATSEEEERFLREARAAAQLSHPGIVPVLEIAHDRGVPYIVSEYIEGLTLADLLTARRPGFRESAELIADVADALDYAHRQKIVHRDVKPSNLLLDGDGRPHITDFGLAHRGEGEITVTLDGQILGTPAYMSPEQAAGDRQRVDARSDVYSLGVVLYELLTGLLPFRGNQRMLLHQVLHDEPRPPRSLDDRVPIDLETICLKAMAKLPGGRYAGARETADDLRRFLNGDPIHARPVGRAEKLARWARRNPVVATLTATAALLLLTATTVSIRFALYQRQANRELAGAIAEAEQSRREAERRAAGAAVDLDLKHLDDDGIEYGMLRLARTLRDMPVHASELRQYVEMNLLALAQRIRPLGPTFQYDGAETTWELSPDGLTVLTGGLDGTARLWDAFSGEVRATLHGHRGKIASVAFSQDGRVAMTVGADRTVRVWDASDGQPRGVTARRPGEIDEALLSADGRRLLTIVRGTHRNSQSVVTLWDTATGMKGSVLVGHAGSVHSAAFSPDGRTVLTGGSDRTVRIWSVESGKALATLDVRTGLVIGVAFSPEGDEATTLDTDPDSGTSSVRWWDLTRFQQIGPPCVWRGEIGEGFRLIHRDVAFTAGAGGMMYQPNALYFRGLPNAIGIDTAILSTTSGWADDHCVFDSDGRSYDRSSGKRRAVEPGRGFNPELAQFAIGHRFIGLGAGLADLVTDKEVLIGSDPVRYDRVRYVPDRRALMIPHWPSARYLPMPDISLDIEVARLFAEVVTCYELDPTAMTRPLDEVTWDDRRKQLVHRLDADPAPPLIGRLAADPWYWLRLQADRANARRAHDEEIKYLDRLISVEPTWPHYHRRAIEHYHLDRRLPAARDFLEAAKLAGEGYWHHPEVNPEGRQSVGSEDRDAWSLVQELVLPTTCSPEEYRWGLLLAEPLSRALTEYRDIRVMPAIALYRLGRYEEALSRLESWRQDRVRTIVSQVASSFRMGWPAMALSNQRFVESDSVKATAFLAMTHHRLGHRDRARAALDDLRRLGDAKYDMAIFGPQAWKTDDKYQELLHEAEKLLEGRSQPGK